MEDIRAAPADVPAPPAPPTPVDFDVAGARSAGYSDSEIASYLGQQSKFDVEGARKAGYGDADIITYLVPPKAVEPPKPGTLEAMAPLADETDYFAADAPQSQLGADLSAAAQGLVGGTGAIVAGAGRRVTAAASDATKAQIAAMDAIDAGKTLPAERDPLGYQDMSPEQRAKARADLAAADTTLAKREPNALTAAGTAVQEFAQTTFPVAPENEGIQTGAARLVGGLAPALAASAAGTAVGGPVGGVLAAAGVIGAQTYDGTYQEAVKKGATPEEAEDAAGKSAMVQIAAMSVPIGKLLPLIPVPLREGLVKTLVNLGQHGIEFSAGNALGTFANNYVARETFDPDRKLTQGVMDAGAEGLIAGLVIRGGGAAVAAARARAAAPGAIADIAAAPDVDTAIAAAGKAASGEPASGPSPGWRDVLPTRKEGAAVDPAARPSEPAAPDAAPGAPFAAGAKVITPDGATGTIPHNTETTVNGEPYHVVQLDGGGVEIHRPQDLRAATAEPAAGTTPAPESAGAAATPAHELGPLTPKQEAAYRATAEGQKLLEPQSFGTPDNTEYVRGVTPSEAETAQTVAKARELKTLRMLNPDVAEEAARIQAENSAARQRHFEVLAGSDVDVANAKALRDERMKADTDAVWVGKQEADTQSVLDAAQDILNGRNGKREIVRQNVRSVLRELTDAEGKPVTDPEILYGVGEHINDLLDKNDAGGQKANARASAALMTLKDALYAAIESAAPGFAKALDNYRQASIHIDAMEALQKFEPRLYDANSRMTYAKVQAMMKQIVDSRQAPGLNKFKSISDETMAGLWDLRDDLRRAAAAENMARTPGGSDTAQNTADAMRETAMGAGSALLRIVPVLGPAINRGKAVVQPLLDARSAAERSRRGMTILRPENPPRARQDIAPPDAPWEYQPVQPRPDAGDLFNQPGRPAGDAAPDAKATPQAMDAADQQAAAAGWRRMAPGEPIVPGQKVATNPENGRQYTTADAAPPPRSRAIIPDTTQLQREQSAVAAMIARADQPQPPAEPAREAPQSGGGDLYRSTTARTPSGTPVEIRYVVREASDLIASQLPDGRANPAFPPELQPRDRTRAASSDQVNSIANRLQPDRLGYAGDTSTGAPVIGQDGVVESGNGRTMAIKQAYAEGGPQAAAYRTWLESQGFDTKGMREPVLVRERTAALDMAARARLADEMGASPTMALSASERAAGDAKRIPLDVLGMLRGGDVTSSGNAAFVRAFAEHAIPAGERAGFMTSDGDLSVEGAARVRNALVQRAYGSNSLVTALAEHADPELKAFGGALMDAAGPMAKLRGAIETGEVPPGSDITPGIIEAANIIQAAKRTRMSLADAVAQIDAFNPRDPWADRILAAAFGDDFGGRMSRPKLAHLFADFANEMQMQSGLFGDNKSTVEVFQGATQKHGHGTGKGAAGTKPDGS